MINERSSCCFMKNRSLCYFVVTRIESANCTMDIFNDLVSKEQKKGTLKVQANPEQPPVDSYVVLTDSELKAFPGPSSKDAFVVLDLTKAKKITFDLVFGTTWAFVIKSALTSSVSQAGMRGVKFFAATLSEFYSWIEALVVNQSTLFFLASFPLTFFEEFTCDEYVPMTELHENSSEIAKFFSACGERNWKFIQEMYLDDATFSDPFYPNLGANEVRAMWYVPFFPTEFLRRVFQFAEFIFFLGKCFYQSWNSRSRTWMSLEFPRIQNMELLNGK